MFFVYAREKIVFTKEKLKEKEDSVIEEIQKIFEHIKGLKTRGHNASYIPELKKTDDHLFSLSICFLDGRLINFGDANVKVPIESVAKVFTLALVLEQIGSSQFMKKIGLESSSKPFNSLSAVKKSKTHTINPFVNAGAMATLSLLQKPCGSRMFDFILTNMKLFAANVKLKVNKNVYNSEMQTNERNRKLIEELRKYDRFYGDPDEVIEAYTKQSSVMVTTKDVAIMAATLANGGINPVSRERLILPSNIKIVLDAMKLGGLYNESEDFYKHVDSNVYAKSGVGGLIMVVIPNVLGLCVLSSPLDGKGNSEKGIKLIKELLPKMK